MERSGNMTEELRNRHRWKICLVLWAVLAFALLLPAVPAQAKVKKTWEEMKVKAKVTSFTEIKLSWPKQPNVKQHVVYEVSRNDSGGEKLKKLKTLAASKTSYTLKVKKGKVYTYRVEAQQKVKNDKQKIWFGYAEATTTLARAKMDENLAYEGKTTSSSIKLSFGASGGLGLDGYEILRRPAKGGSLQKIKTITTTEKSKTYTDKDVKQGESYEYRIRTFKTVKGRRYVGISCTPVVMTAVNQKAKLTVKTKNLSGDEMTVTLKSDKGNGTLEVFASDLRDRTWTSGAGELHRITAYSTDGTNWIEFLESRDEDMDDPNDNMPEESEEDTEILVSDLDEADSSAETDPSVLDTSDQTPPGDSGEGQDDDEEGDSGDGSGMDNSDGAKRDGDMDEGSMDSGEESVYVNQIATRKSRQSSSSKSSSKNSGKSVISKGFGKASRAEGDFAKLKIEPGSKLWLRVRKGAASEDDDGMNALDGDYDLGISGWVFPASYHGMPYTYLVIELNKDKAYSYFDKKALQ